MRSDFNEVFFQDFQTLVGFVMKLGADQASAEDAAQTAYAAAFRSWDGIRHPEAWVRKVATRAYFNDLGRQGRRDHPLHDDLLIDDMELAENVAQVDHVFDVLRRLPERQRIVMAWHLDGYSPREIAEQLDCSAESIRQALRRARESIKRMLAADGEGGPH